MSRRTIGNNPVTVCLAALVILPACVSGVANLVRDNRVTIQTESPRKITLSVNGVYQKGAYLEISGGVFGGTG